MGLTELYKRASNKLRSQVPKQAATQKTYEGWATRAGNQQPTVSFVIQSHNKSDAVLHNIKKLRRYPNAEIIVIDDGSQPEHVVKLAQEMTNGNEFILRANDLYEVVTYDRALYLARGTYVALLQDDDELPADRWIHEAVQHFAQHPDLVILGGRNAVNMLPLETTPDGQRGDYEAVGDLVQRKNCFKGDLAGTGAEAAKNAPFRFVQTVNRAPMWIHRPLFMQHLRHIDQSYAPFQWDDAEICLRAYAVGLKVGWYPAGFGHGGTGEGGMRIWNNALHHRQDETNARQLYQVYGHQLARIQATVEEANRALATAR